MIEDLDLIIIIAKLIRNADFKKHLEKIVIKYVDENRTHCDFKIQRRKNKNENHKG